MDKQIFKTIYDLIIEDIDNTSIDCTNEEDVTSLRAKHLIKKVCAKEARDLILQESQNQNNNI